MASAVEFGTRGCRSATRQLAPPLRRRASAFRRGDGRCTSGSEVTDERDLPYSLAMKVVYMVRRFPVLSETFILREIQELIRQGENITLCSLALPDRDEPRHPGAENLTRAAIYLADEADRPPRPLAAAATAVFFYPGQVFLMLPSVLALCRAERAVDPLRHLVWAAWLSRRVPSVEHVHAHFAHAPATVAMFLARLRRVPFSFTTHARDVFVLTRAAALKLKVAQARFVITVTLHTRELVVAAVPPSDRHKVLVLRNSIDPKRFPRRLAEPEGAPLILSVARLVEKKGSATLIRACAVLVQRRIRFRCELVGDGPLRDSLLQAIDDLRLSRCVRLRGPLSETDVRQAYEGASVFVLPCQVAASGDSDAFPVALLEAMSIGVPVVTTPVAGIPETIRDGECGLLVPPRSPELLADAIQRVLTEPSLRMRLVAGGHEVASASELAAAAQRLRNLFASQPADPALEHTV
jgi:glycosyltransferase involved in cell wall biosynthesis